MGIYNGNNLRVYVGGTLVAGNTSCSIEITSNEVEQNTKDSGRFITARPTTLRATVTADHLFDEADAGVDAIIDAQIAGTPVTILVGETSPVAGEISLSGSFLVGSTSISASANEDATASWTFNSTGTVTYTVGTGV